MALISNLQFVGSARTTIGLNNFTTSTIMDVSAYDAGEIAGWFYINGTAKYRFWFSAKFAKNGPANDFWISPSTTGDAPPAGFSITATEDGLIRTFIPNIPGFVSATVTYALDAPAVGAQYPIFVDGSQITPASATVQGVVTTGAQTLAGVKTFSSTPVAPGMSPVDTTGLTFTGAVSNTVTAVSGAITLTHAHYYISASGASAYTITLPTAVGITGRSYIIKSNLNSGILLTVGTTSSQTIDGSTSITLSRFAALHVISNGSNWEIY
jgi:hypothetical protein